MDPTVASLIAGVVLLAAGLVFCFRGRALFRYYLAAAGFVVGYVLAEALMGMIGDFSFSLAVNLVAGIVLALVGYFVLSSTPALAAGLALGPLLTLAVIRAFGIGKPYTEFILILLGLLIGAAIGATIGKDLITYSTALGGAAMAATGALVALSIWMPIEWQGTIEYAAISIGVMFLLGALGYYLQTEPAKSGDAVT